MSITVTKADGTLEKFAEGVHFLDGPLRILDAAGFLLKLYLDQVVSCEIDGAAQVIELAPIDTVPVVEPPVLDPPPVDLAQPSS